MAQRKKAAVKSGKPSGVAIRGAHLDLKGLPPTFKRLLELLEVIKAAGYTALLVEWEDMFPWHVHEGMRSPSAYSEKEVQTFIEEAAGRDLEVIPLVQCLGHMETPLSLPEFAHLREVPYRSDGLDPLAPGARKLVEDMVDDVLSLMPDVRYFHLGGDEARTLGKGEQTARYAREHGKDALYLHHVEPLVDGLNDRGIRPILWSDMMHSWPDEKITAIAAKADLCPWGYRGHPDEWAHHSGTRHIERFHKNGVTLWGATAYKGATTHNADLCDYVQQEQNALGWVEIAARFGLVGLFATAWSRFSTDRVQNEPVDGCLDSLVNVAHILSKGVPAGREYCLDLLSRLGERRRFEICRDSLLTLSEARHHAWRAVRSLREQVVLETREARRRTSGTAMMYLLDLQRNVEVAAAEGAAQFREAFRGLLDERWIDSYLAERIEPLFEELGALEPRVRMLEGEIHRAASGRKRWNE